MRHQPPLIRQKHRFEVPAQSAFRQPSAAEIAHPAEKRFRIEPCCPECNSSRCRTSESMSPKHDRLAESFLLHDPHFPQFRRLRVHKQQGDLRPMLLRRTEYRCGKWHRQRVLPVLLRFSAAGVQLPQLPVVYQIHNKRLLSCAYSPFHTGFRFSAKAFAPSFKSSERLTASTAEQASWTVKASFSGTISVIRNTCLIAG